MANTFRLLVVVEVDKQAGGRTDERRFAAAKTANLRQIVPKKESWLSFNHFRLRKTSAS